MTGEPEVLGVSEIARRLDVKQPAVSAWIIRGWPPGAKGAEPVTAPEKVNIPGLVTRGTFYRWEDVIAWAKATGRWTKAVERKEAKRLSASKPRLRLGSKRTGQ